MLAVVEFAFVKSGPSGPPAELAAGFENDGAGAGGGEFNGRGEAGPTGADDSNAQGGAHRRINCVPR